MYCIKVKADKRIKHLLDSSLMLVTALAQKLATIKLRLLQKQHIKMALPKA